MGVRDHAVVVGINAYSKLSKLRGAEADAVAFAAWLKHPRGGDVPADNVTTILSSTYGEPTHPTQARPMVDDVRSEIERLIDDAGEELRLGRRLYLYLSGHGFAPSVEETALLMTNASMATLHHLPCVRYANQFRESTIFEEIVLVMDCCRDHVTRPPSVDLGLPPIAVANADATFFFAFATRWSLSTREGIDDNGIVRGHFTRAMIEGLDRPNATSRSVAAYVKARLPELADRKGYYKPEFKCGRTIRFGPASRDGDDPMCEVRVTFDRPQRGVMLRILNNEKQVVAEAAMEISPWTVPLRRGLYELVRSDTAVRTNRFRVPPTGTKYVAA